MRLRTYSAKSTTEAMEKVRAELGDDAIIVANRRGPGGRGVQLTAAIDEKEEDLNVIASLTENDYPAPAEIADAARAALDFHGVPRNLVNRLITALNELNTDDTTVALAGALDIGFKFEPLPVKRGHKPLILIGPPGSGKTLCTAKLATRAKLNNQPVEVYSADLLRAAWPRSVGRFHQHSRSQPHHRGFSFAIERKIGRRRKDGLKNHRYTRH